MTVFEIKDENLELPLDKKIEKLLETLVLRILSEKKPLYKEAISKNLDDKLGFQLSPCHVDSLLDSLWFEEMVRTEYRNGKCVFSLTKKGEKAVNAKNVRSHFSFKQRFSKKSGKTTIPLQ